MGKLNAEEKALLASLERGEWHSIDGLEEKKKRYQSYAKNAQKKGQRINVRLTKGDLLAIQAIAREEGLPYQTLITSILHKYASGRLVDRQLLSVDR